MANIFDQEVNDYFSLQGIGQTQRYRAYCKVIVNGINVPLDTYLMSVLVKDGPVWEATIELDDRDGRLDIPPFNSSLVIYLGWTSESSYRVFNGNISDIEHGFGRKLGGRRMTIHGLGYQQGSAVKTPFQDHAGEGAPPGKMQGDPIMFTEAAQQFAGNAGLTVSVGPSFASTMSDYWSMNNESAMQWFARQADDHGAMSRIEGNNIVFNAMQDFNKPNIRAVWGDNLISWRIRPFAARSIWSGAEQQFYDHMLGQWTKTNSQFSLASPFGGWASAIFKTPNPAPNAQVAQQTIAGAQEKTNMYSGEGRIMINGEPQCSWGGTITIVGARPGVDGTYYIMCADHSWSRQGYVTTCEVVPNPDGDVSAGYTSVPTEGATATAPSTPTSTNPVVVNNADGSVTTYFSNGSVSVQNALGTTTINPDGSKDFQPVK